ncbi:hypothetical protein [Microbulbifer sp. JMSA002]|uniref:hypothetical protein n=1 Tax=Microbulbifer sp. JMSA002 TaxID=3243368 RepID=UPI004039184A
MSTTTSSAAIIVSSLALISSTLSVIITYLNYKKNQGRLAINCHVQLSEPKSGKGKLAIAITVSNVGLRPILIKSAGTVCWSSGGYTCGENKDLYKTLQEAESTVIYEHIENLPSIRRIKKIGVCDHTGKKWYLSKEQIHALYDLSYANSWRENPFNKGPSSYAKEREKSLKKYLKFIKKYNLKNELKGKAGSAWGDKHINDKIKREFNIN